jgi:hypothetical protein
MNWKNRNQRNKEVNISLEYTHKADLKRILDVLSDLITSGNESYSDTLKSVENEGIVNRFNFVQYYSDSIHESKESEINGELKFVIKAKL